MQNAHIQRDVNRAIGPAAPFSLATLRLVSAACSMHLLILSNKTQGSLNNGYINTGGFNDESDENNLSSLNSTKFLNFIYT